MKKIIPVFLTGILIVFLVSCSKAPETDPVAMSNFMRDAPFYFEDDIIIGDVCTNGYGGVFGKANIDGSDSKKLEDGFSEHINRVGDELYFVLCKDDSSELYKCSLAGEGVERVKAGNIDYLSANGDKLYYSKGLSASGNQAGYFCCDLNGENEEQILKDQVFYPYVVGDYVYYIDNSPFEHLHRYNMTTKEDEEITNRNTSGYTVIGNDLYYVGIENQIPASEIADYHKGKTLFKMNLNSGEETILYKNAGYYYVIMEDKIYFINGDDADRIYSMSLDGKDIKAVTKDKYCELMGGSNGTLIYADMDDSGNYEYWDGVYTCDTDGNNRVTIAKW